MKVQIGSLPKGRKITLTEHDGDCMTVARFIVGKQVQAKSGRPVVEVRRPNKKSIYTRIPTDFLVEV